MSKPTAMDLVREISELPYMKQSPSVILADRVEAVLALHRDRRPGVKDYSYTECLECECRLPCPTVRILNGESE